MSAMGNDGVGEAALAEVMASRGVVVSDEEIAPVARALERINAAAGRLPRPSFDDTAEAYYRLLEQDGAGAAA